MKPKKRILIPVALLALAVIGVRVVLSRGADAEGLSASGTVEATEAQLGFQSGGRIEWLGAREGDRVRAGQELARLDAAELRARQQQAAAQADAARAQLAELEHGARSEEVAQARSGAAAAAERLQDARRDLARTEELFRGGAVSREAFDKARTAVQLLEQQQQQAREQQRLVESGPRPERIAAARAQLAQAEAAVRALDASLANAALRAPFAGVVSVRHREPGEIVAPGSPVLTLLDPADRWVKIYVPENRLGAVRLGSRAEITSDSYPQKRYTGDVVYIAGEAEFTPKTVQTAEERVKLVYAVKVRVTGDAAGELKPGMPADVRLLSSAR